MPFGTITNPALPNRISGDMTEFCIAIPWTADADGKVDQAFGIPCGNIHRWQHAPGTPAPADGHSIKLVDEWGMDLLQDSGSTCSGSVSETHTPQTPEGGLIAVFHNQQVRLVIEATTDSAEGTFIIFIR